MKKRIITGTAAILITTLVFSFFMQTGAVTDDELELYGDVSTFGVSANEIVPSPDSLSASGYTGVTAEDTDRGLKIAYSQDLANTYAIGVASVHADDLHCKMEVTGAKTFWLVLGTSGKNPNKNGVLSVKIMRSAQKAEFYYTQGSKPISFYSLTGLSSIYSTDKIEIHLKKKENGTFDFAINDKTYTINSSNLNKVPEFANNVNNGNLWLYVAPSSNAPTFLIRSLHYDGLCLDELLKVLSVDDVSKVTNTVNLIKSIGAEINTESIFAIEAARNAYNALSDTVKEYIVNYKELVAAEERYEEFLEAEYSDTAAYMLNSEQIYPTADMLSSWAWTKVIALTSGGIGFDIRYLQNQPCPYAYGLKKIANDNVHAKMKVTNADKFWVSLGGRQKHPGLAGTVSFLFIKSQKKICVYYGTGSTTSDVSTRTLFDTVTDVNSLSESDNIEFKMNENDDGTLRVLINDDFSFTIASDLIELAGNFGDLIQKQQLYLNVAPENTAPDFLIKSIHSGDDICFDELVKEIGKDNVKTVLAANSKISEIEPPITLESGLSIMEAEALVNQLPKEYQKYVTENSSLITYRKLYDKLNSDNLNLDPKVYPVSENTVGPNHYWSDDVATWYSAESGKGVTLEFNNCTVHNIGLDTINTLQLDGLHLTFANMKYTGQGNNFALIFAKNNQTDMTSNQKAAWMTFSVKETGVIIRWNTQSMGSFEVINTKFVTASDFAKEWDIEFEAQNDGSYLLTLNHAISAVIPKKQIVAATDAGLNTSQFAVTFACNNIGNAPMTLKMDVISVHDGKVNCYCDITKGDALAAENCENLIDEIGVVTENSGDAIKAAKSAFDALGSNIQGLVSNADILQNALHDYESISKDIIAAQDIIGMISKLPASITSASYKKYLDAYNAYLDLFPRTRKYVTNASRLLNAVKQYEKKNNVNLMHEGLNEITGGKNAHYNK